MSNPELNQLKRAEQLFDASKFNEAFKVLSDFEKKDGLTLHNKLSSHLLRTDFLFQQGRYKELLKLAEETYNESLGLGKNLLSIDALIWMACALTYLYRLDKANDLIMQGEELLKKLPHKISTDYKQREAFIAYTKGYLYQNKGDADQALECHKHSLCLREKLGIKHKIAESLNGIVYILSIFKGELINTLKYAKQSLDLSKKSTKKYYLADSFNHLAVVYALRGDLDRSIILFEQSFAIFKQLNNKRKMSILLNNIGENYRMKGELDRSLAYLKQSLEQISIAGDLFQKANVHDYLIQTLIEKDDLEQAQQYFNHLEQLNNLLNDKQINLIYFFVKALLLKKSPRIKNKGKAEEILKQILENKDLTYELTMRALINLCELLLIEFQMTNEVEVLDELKSLIGRLLEISEKSHSYWILSETYLLKSKFSLLTFNIKEAQRYLTHAQKIAESYGIKRLAMKISYEHDELIKKLNMWKKLRESDVSLSERLKLAGLNEQIENMVKKRVIDVPELSEEQPVTIFIITEGGTPLLSHSFINEKSIESHLFGGFLTTIDYFIKEMFSEGLDRAIFGDYTLLMKSIPPFFISYIFKGDSYYALQKINYFVDHLQKEDFIWQNLLKSFQTNKSIHLKDVPLLESLLKETFIAKSIAFNK